MDVARAQKELDAARQEYARQILHISKCAKAESDNVKAGYLPDLMVLPVLQSGVAALRRCFEASDELKRAKLSEGALKE